MKNLLLLFLFIVITASSAAQTSSERTFPQQKLSSTALQSPLRQKPDKQVQTPAPKALTKHITLQHTVLTANKNTDFSRLRSLTQRQRASAIPSATIAFWASDFTDQKIGSMGGSTQLLVADASAVDSFDETSMTAMWNLFLNGGQPLADFYHRLHATLPANAEPTLDYSQGLVDQADILTLHLNERNTFDIILAGIDSLYYYGLDPHFSTPVPEALEDNLICENQWIYFFDYSWWQYPTLIRIPPYEIQAIALETTPSSAELTAAEPIRFTIENTGNQPLSSLRFYLRIDDGPEILETFTAPADSTLDLGEYLTYTFHARADLSSVGTHTLHARAEIDNEYDDSNNALSIQRHHTSPQALPFFDPMDEDLSQWTIIDLNGTDSYGGGTWTPFFIYDADYNPDYQALYGYAEDRPGDDWLRTASPYTLDAGPHHIAFLQQCMMEEFPEVLSVYYGTSPDVTTMTLLDHFALTNTALLNHIVNFDNPTAGNYYFAFRASSDADMFGIIIDNITIAPGSQEPQPDLYLYHAFFKSYPSCQLSDSAAVVVYNLGQIPATIHSFDLQYNIDNGPWQTKTITEPLASGSHTIVYLDQLDLDAPGLHTLTVVGQLDNQLTTDNDRITATIEKTLPITTLPYTADFSNPDHARDWTVLNAGDWELEDGYYIPIWANPLLSRCIDLLPGDHTFAHTYKAGAYIAPLDLYLRGNYTLRIGESGTDPYEWTTLIAEAYDLYQSTDTTVVHPFTIDRAGSYTLAINAGMFSLKQVTLAPQSVGLPHPAETKNAIRLTPNPATDRIHIQSDNAAIDRITLLDLSGQIVLDLHPTGDSNNLHIPFPPLANGMYLVKITTANAENNQIQKLLIRR
jgi:hypothetical protein